MKTFNFLKSLVLAITTVAFLSCGGSDDGGGGGNGSGGNENTTSSITISASSSTIDLGQSITFTVRDNNNANKTSQSTIYVDGTAISGATFTPSAEGTFAVYAKFGTFTSSTISVTVNGSAVSVIVISADKYVLLPNGTFTFSALGNGGVDLSTDATYSVNGTEISGNTYTPTERGSFNVTCSYDGTTSNEITVVAGYVQKVLVEDFTGTWCGYCPRVGYSLEQAENQSDDIYGVAVHNGTSDPMTYEFEAQLRAAVGITSFPSGQINRTIVWTNNGSPTEPLNARGINPTLGLGLDTTLNGTAITIDVKVGYVSATSNVKLVIYLVEDGKIYPQINYYNDDASSPWFGTGNPINNYVHNNVLRKAFTDVFGDTIPDGVAGGEYTQTFNVQMPSNVEDETKLQVIAFVIDDTGNAINSMRVDLGDSQDYQ